MENNPNTQACPQAASGQWKVSPVFLWVLVLPSLSPLALPPLLTSEGAPSSKPPGQDQGLLPSASSLLGTPKPADVSVLGCYPPPSVDSVLLPLRTSISSFPFKLLFLHGTWASSSPCCLPIPFFEEGGTRIQLEIGYTVHGHLRLTT